jgi:excisionase family DNA binding protein
MAPSHEIMTMQEVSDLTGVPVGTLIRWRHFRTYGPPSYKIGGRVRYDRSRVMKWLEDERQDSRR